MKPFFTYYGGKWRSAPKYPTPLHDTIIEPFAGAAGYSLRHSAKKVILVDKDPTIASLWKWLITAKESEILALPLLNAEDNIDSFDIRPEAKHLIGFWLNKGAASPCKTPSKWMRSGLRPNSYWGETIRGRIAEQLGGIRHWTALQANYTSIDNTTATWFIDPPYISAGTLYRHPSNQLDFATLGSWCRSREGQVIVCEGPGANWLPFNPFTTSKSSPSNRGKGYSKEYIWTNEQPTTN